MGLEEHTALDLNRASLGNNALVFLCVVRHLGRVCRIYASYNLTFFCFFCLSVINYEVTVVTGDVTFAGTNAKVFVQIYGDKGKTEVITTESRSNNYERDSTEIFKVSKASSSEDYTDWGERFLPLSTEILSHRLKPKMWGKYSKSAWVTMAWEWGRDGSLKQCTSSI